MNDKLVGIVFHFLINLRECYFKNMYKRVKFKYLFYLSKTIFILLKFLFQY